MNEKKQNPAKPEPERDPANRDPITGAPGAHPVGTGIGAAAAGAAGAAIGSVGGPAGAAVGLVAGSIVGGLAGKAITEEIDPTAEDAYWRTHHSEQPYAQSRPYEVYAGGYRTGYEGYSKYASTGRTCEECDAELAADYQKHRGTSEMTWEEAKHAARAAWNRVRDQRQTAAGKSEPQELDAPRYTTEGPETGRQKIERYQPKERSKP